MVHDVGSIGLLFTFTSALTIALIFGFIAQKIKLSPLTGYLTAGVLVSPYSPGIVADINVTQQFAEIGIILLMFGVGLHFKLSDLLAVKKIAILGAASQIIISTLISAVLVHFLGWSWVSGIIFGISLSVASTVVLTRVLSDNRLLHTATGHAAIGWLIMEDIFTILVLVLMPVFFDKTSSGGNIAVTFFLTLLKLIFLIIFALVIGQKVIPILLRYIAKTGSRELFTLSVLVIALGIAVGAAQLFGASMALGAFLAGMVVGQSDFSARATSEALPISDVFTVLFFVSVGMLFNISSVAASWQLIVITFAVVILVKPVVATLVVLFLKQPMKKAIHIAAALGQIGEFSFVLASVAVSYNLIPQQAYNAIIFVSIVTITFNTLVYRCIEPVLKYLTKKGILKTDYTIDNEIEKLTKDVRHIIIVGYGPVGRTVSNILLKEKINVIVIEMNIDTVREIKKAKTEGLFAVHGDASQREILLSAGIKTAESFVISTPVAPAKDIIEVVKSLNSRIKILINTAYLKQAQNFRKDSDLIVCSGEGSVALALSKIILKSFGNTEVEAELNKIYEELV